MALYSQCFAWVIKKINSRIRSKEDFKSIGILDIFGFENFEVCFKSLFRWIVWYWCFVVLYVFVIFTGIWLLNVLWLKSVHHLQVKYLTYAFLKISCLLRWTVLNSSILTMQMKSSRSISISTFFLWNNWNTAGKSYRWNLKEFWKQKYSFEIQVTRNLGYFSLLWKYLILWLCFFKSKLISH